MGIPFADAKATFTQKDFDVKRTFDGNLDGGKRGWALAGTNLKIPQRAVFKLKEPAAGDSENGAALTVGVLCRFKSHPIARFRVYITTDADPLHFGIPAHIADAMGKEAGQRIEEERKALAAWVGESDVEYQNRRWAAKGPIPPVPPDKKIEELKKALKYAETPIEEDPRLIRFRKDVEMSAGQSKKFRLTAAQDLTWALINNPSFLFNH